MGEATAERHAPTSKHEWSKTIDNMCRVEQPDGIMVTLFRGAGGMAKGRLPRVRRRLARIMLGNRMERWSREAHTLLRGYARGATVERKVPTSKSNAADEGVRADGRGHDS